MTTRIALHYLRQSWGMYLVAMLPLVVLWTGAAEAGALSRQVVLAITLGVAALIGPATTTTRMTPTEVRLLPISRHRLWVARWLVSVVVPTLWVGACMLAGRTLTVALTRLGTLGADTAGLALVTVFLYLGMVMALHALTGVVRFADGRLRPGWLWGACRLGLHLGAAGSVFWGFLFRKYLPVSIDGLSVGMLVVLALGAVATLAGAMYRPDQGAFVDARQLSAAPLKATARWQRFDDPFTGLPKLFWWTWRELSVPLVLMFACVTVVEFGWPGWGIELEEMLPFGRVAEGLPSILIMMVILLAGQAGDLPGQTDVTASTARHLRVLPLNPMALTFYLVFRRAVGWLTLWVGAIALYALVVGRPELLRLDWLLFLVGIDAMVDAVRLRAGIRRSIAVPLLLAAVFAIATVVVNGLAGGPTLASVAQVLIGTVALAAAVIVHYGAVRSGTALYTASGSDGLSGASALGQ